MLKKVKILEVSDNDKPKFVKTQLVTAIREGDEKPIYWEMIKGHDSVHIIVFNTTTQEFLLVRQVRIPVLVNNPNDYLILTEACAGLVDKKTSIQQIAKEEIEEELGYDISVDKVKFIKTIKSSVGTAGTNAHLFYAEVIESEKISDGGGLNSEDIEVIRVHKKDIKNFMFNAETDAVTLALISYYLMHFNILIWDCGQ